MDREIGSSGRQGVKTLTHLCRNIIVTNLERYPPNALGILDELEWESIIRFRHKKTRPQKGKGGLDGTGRMNPAVSEKFLLEVEEGLPQFSQSGVVDELVWKDIVQQRFRVGGLSRPKGLLYPWPVLETLTGEAGRILLDLSKKDSISDEDKMVGFKAIRKLCDLPMNVSLLKSSGVGKAAKKFLKACKTNHQLECFNEASTCFNLRESHRTILETTLQSWKEMAETSGVRMKDMKGTPVAASEPDKHIGEAKKCSSWRELFRALRQNDEKRKSNQGARMRERRQRLDSVRPKIVKVRHATSRQSAMLNRNTRGSIDPAIASARNSKVQQLRMEAVTTSTRRAVSLTQPNSKAKNVGFGAAVAFAQRGPTKRKSPPPSTMVALAGGKRMKVPNTKKAKSSLQQRIRLKKPSSQRPRW